MLASQVAGSEIVGGHQPQWRLLAQAAIHIQRGNAAGLQLPDAWRDGLAGRGNDQGLATLPEQQLDDLQLRVDAPLAQRAAQVEAHIQLAGRLLGTDLHLPPEGRIACRHHTQALSRVNRQGQATQGQAF